MEEIRFGRPVRTERVEPVVERMIESIFRNQDALISIARLKQMDEYTYMHSMSVCVLMISFGKQLGYDAGQLKEVGIGAMLHDIGKMKIPLEILNKNKKLSNDEYDYIKKHVEFSNMLLKESHGITDTSVIVASEHHERVDGTGYPGGMKGDKISGYGQAAAITDVYDAMTSQRCYQRSSEPTDVLKKLFEWNFHFNRNMVEHFVRCVGIYPVGSLVRLESGFLAVVTGHNEKDLLRPDLRAVYDISRDKFIYPVDVDLSGTNSSDSIICSESQDRWKIRADRYIQEENKISLG
jgi:HD-GYP domain-containing protein (c-di-GMP phosphodiesterase class II)